MFVCNKGVKNGRQGGESLGDRRNRRDRNVIAEIGKAYR
jgi:hypothetical protein